MQLYQTLGLEEPSLCFSVHLARPVIAFQKSACKPKTSSVTDASSHLVLDLVWCACRCGVHRNTASFSFSSGSGKKVPAQRVVTSVGCG